MVADSQSSLPKCLFAIVYYLLVSSFAIGLFTMVRIKQEPYAYQIWDHNPEIS